MDVAAGPGSGADAAARRRLHDHPQRCSPRRAGATWRSLGRRTPERPESRLEASRVDRAHPGGEIRRVSAAAAASERRYADGLDRASWPAAARGRISSLAREVGRGRAVRARGRGTPRPAPPHGAAGSLSHAAAAQLAHAVRRALHVPELVSGQLPLGGAADGIAGAAAHGQRARDGGRAGPHGPGRYAEVDAVDRPDPRRVAAGARPAARGSSHAAPARSSAIRPSARPRRRRSGTGPARSARGSCSASAGRRRPRSPPGRTGRSSG